MSPPTATVAKVVSRSPAANVLQARALQCSFSSVFHLKKAGMEYKKVKFVENMFAGAVGGPLAVMAITGLVAMDQKDRV